MLLFFPELPHNNPKKTPKAEALGVLRVLLIGILCLLSLYILGCERSLTLYLLPPNSATRSVETSLVWTAQDLLPRRLGKTASATWLA